MSTALDRRLEAWFSGRRWRVMTEKTGTVTLAGLEYFFDRGTFQVSPPGAYVTPLGHRGRRGLLIIETADGRDIPGTEAAFGEAALRRASQAFHTIAGLDGEG